MRVRTALGFLMLALATAGCPPASNGSGGPTEICTKQFEQCKLPGGGQLGVCDRRECKDDESPPCFVCMPQH